MTFGLLIQLNWLEAETAKDAYLNQGVENTYLDIFWNQYASSGSDEDLNLETQSNWGAGLRIEF